MKGKLDLKYAALQQYQIARTNAFLPGLYQELSYDESKVVFIDVKVRNMTD